MSVPNKRLKLPGRLSEEACVWAPASPYRNTGRLRPPALAPQLKREPLGRDGGQMMRRALLLLSTLTLLPIVLAAQREQPHSYVPDSGFVPNAATAISDHTRSYAIAPYKADDPRGRPISIGHGG